jgi:aspartyl-tRNA(Asn)/glutamyl-tRNA(Gln) amidotransferase subunit B
VLAAHPSEVERYRSGKTGILGFLVAQVMKQAGPASPKLVNVLLTRELGGR